MNPPMSTLSPVLARALVEILSSASPPTIGVGVTLGVGETLGLGVVEGVGVTLGVGLTVAVGEGVAVGVGVGEPAMTKLA